MTNSPSYLSPEKKKELALELEELKTVRRKEIAEALEFAKSLGDLSENAEYHEARESQATLEERISKIEDLLKNAVIVSGSHGSVIDVGSTVTLKNNTTGHSETWHIVGSEEVNVLDQKISNESPLGQVLVGREKGVSVTLETPRGSVEYKIIEVA